MSAELIPVKQGATHWVLSMFGVTACGLITPGTSVPTTEKVSELSCLHCIQYVSKIDGRIFWCDICDRYWFGLEDADLHILSHED